MSPGAYAALAATFAVFAITPGPAVAAIVARAVADGARPALALVVMVGSAVVPYLYFRRRGWL